MALVILIFSAVASLQLHKLSTEYSMDQFFPTDHPLLQQSLKNRQTFQLDQRSSFLVVLEWPKQTRKNWLNPQNMKGLAELTHSLQNLNEIQSAVSIATVEGVLDENKSLVVGPLFERLALAKWKDFTLANGLLRSQLISEDFRSVLLLIQPKKLPPQTASALSKRLQHIVSQKFPQTQVQVGGVPAIQGQLSTKLFSELKIFLILSLVGFCLVFFIFFKGYSAIVFTLVSLVFVNLINIGFLSYFKIPFSVLLSTLPIIVSISLISVVVHTMHRWAECLEPNLDFESRFQLSFKVIKEMMLPNLLGSTTTAIGFFSLCAINIPLIREYGWVVAASVLLSWLLVHILLVGFISFTTPILRSWTKRKSYWALPILKNARLLLVLIAVFSIAMVWKGTGITFAGRLFDDLPKTESSRKATEKIDSQFGGVVPYDIVLKSNENNFWKHPQNLKKVDALVGRLRKHANVGSVLSFVDFFGGQIPHSKEAVAEFLFLYSMSESNPLKNYVTDDGQSLRVAVRLYDINSSKIENTREHIRSSFHKVFPKVSFQETGFAVSSHTINQEVSRELVFNFWHSILLVGLLLMFVFRSARWALLACLPNLIPPAVLIGFLSLLQTPVKPGVALIFSISMGLAFNNTVYLLSRMKRIMTDKNLSFPPIKRALLQEGNPCLFETLVMLFGFMIFLSSDFKLNQTFGIYMVLSILAGALADLVFLPAFIKFFPQLLRPRARVEKVYVVENPKVGWETAAAIVLVIGSILLIPKNALASREEALELLQKAKSQIEAKDDQSVISMKIIEANGEIKTRVMKMQSFRDKKFHAIIRIQAPVDIKGTAILAEVGSNKEEQWLYLPSSKQVRRVVGAKKSSGLLGSELTMEDLNSAAIKSSELKLLKKDSDQYLIEVTPKPKTSAYSRVLLSFATPTNLPQKTQYFIGKQLRKSVAFSNYIKIGSIWRAQLIQVKNLANKRGTDLSISEIKVNSGLSAADFSVNALKPD